MLATGMSSAQASEKLGAQLFPDFLMPEQMTFLWLRVI